MSLNSSSSVSLSRGSSDISIHINNDTNPVLDQGLRTVNSVLSTQAKAVDYLSHQYQKSEWSKSQMKRSLRIMNNGLNAGGKIIISGMGKSYKIAGKSVATLNSLSLQSALLHPSEALHGDMGIICEERGDILLMISASGNTPELINLLDYIPELVPVILVTCTKNSRLSVHPKVASMIYAELPKRLSEKNLYGLSAPTISTTLCLTILDATSMALAELYINDLNIRKKRFGDRHPGGAIGQETAVERCAAFSQLKIDFPNRANGKDGSNTVSSTSTSSVIGLEKKSESSLEEEVEEEVERVKEKDVLSVSDLVLLGKVKNSKNTVTIHSLSNTEELGIASLLIVYDYILIDSGDSDYETSTKPHISQVLECSLCQQIYRMAKLQGDDWQDIKWKLEDAFVRISL